MNSMRPRQSLLAGLLLASVAVPLVSARAQDPAPAPPSTRSWLQDPAVKEEYKKWLREDVAWIITDEERANFTTLSTDQQRDEFVVAFWERRNPTHAATENKFKEEHYRRLAYANTHFAAGVPGWKTDRGRMYIMFGAPDSTESHPGFSPPSEVWRYSYIEGIGKDVALEFVDTCKCGEYHIPLHPLEKAPPGFKESFPQP
jgi:GWxTD domain-containing protein